MQIARNEEYKLNADLPIAGSWQPGQNITMERIWHAWKHWASTVRMDSGIWIDSRVERSENARCLTWAWNRTRIQYKMASSAIHLRKEIRGRLPWSNEAWWELIKCSSMMASV
jgi:hypothetical protein